MERPQRYDDIRLYLDGLYFAGFLEGNKSKLTFLNSEKFWCSHLMIFCNEGRGMVYDSNDDKYIPRTDTDLFGVYYMKGKDRVWIKANIPCYSRFELTMMSNIVNDEIRKLGSYQIKYDMPQSFAAGKVYVKVLIENHHTEDNIYELFQLFRKCQTNPDYIKNRW